MAILLATDFRIFVESWHIMQNTTTLSFNNSRLTLQLAIFFSVRSIRNNRKLFYIMTHHPIDSYRKYVRFASIVNMHCLLYFATVRINGDADGICGVTAKRV